MDKIQGRKVQGGHLCELATITSRVETDKKQYFVSDKGCKRKLLYKTDNNSTSPKKNLGK